MNLKYYIITGLLLVIALGATVVLFGDNGMESTTPTKADDNGLRINP